MKPFRQLSLVGRGRRLRPIAGEMLTRYGIEPRRLRQMTSATNTIFRVDTAGGETVLLRITAPKSCHGVDEIRSEARWLESIAQDTDIGVPRPISTPDGDFVVTVRDGSPPGAPDEHHGSLYSWLPGRELADVLTEINLERLGCLSARLHLHGATFTAPQGFRIRGYDNVFPYAAEGFPGIEPVVIFEGRYDHLFPGKRRDMFREVIDRAQRVIDRLHQSGKQAQVIHNDLHAWNVKVHRGRLYALDFEDMLWGYPLQDLGTTLFYFRYRDEHVKLITAFRRGYESVTPWPEENDGDLETLIASRGILLANYVAVSDDAEDREYAPGFMERTEARLREFLESR